MSEEMRQLLIKWSKYVKSDECGTDDFLFEGMTFEDTITLMDHISKAVEEYVERH